MAIDVVEVNKPDQLQSFLNCTRTYNPEYSGDPLLQSQLNPRFNPWFRHGKARLFLAVEGSKILGRVAGFIEPRLESPDHGYFGLLETANSPEVCGSLLLEVENWLRSQGKRTSIGPVVFNSNHDMGILIQGSSKNNPFNLPVNPPYYPDLLEECHYQKERDFISYTWPLTKLHETNYLKLAHRVQRDNALVVKRFIDFSSSSQVKLFSQLYQETMAKTWEFASLDRREVKDILLTLSTIYDPDLLLCALYRDRPAALCLTLVNKEGNPCNARLAVLGVIPELRNRGLHATLLTDTLWNLSQRSVTSVELSYVAEDNLPVTRLISNSGATPSRRYRVYKKPLSS